MTDSDKRNEMPKETATSPGNGAKYTPGADKPDHTKAPDRGYLGPDQKKAKEDVVTPVVAPAASNTPTTVADPKAAPEKAQRV